MADYDRNRGNRDTDSYRRPRPQAPQEAGDPLSELARLIGQQNESAPSYRQKGARLPEASPPAADQGWNTPDPHAQPAGRARRASAPAQTWAPSYPDQQNAAPGAYGHGQHDQHYDPSPYAPPFGGPRPQPRQAESHYPDAHYTDARYGEPQADPRYSDQSYADPRYASDPRYGDPRYAEPRYDDGAAHGYADPHYGDQRYDEPNFGTPPAQYGAPSYAPAPHAYSQSDQGYAGQNYAGFAYQDDGRQVYDDSAYSAHSAAVMPPAADERRPAKRSGSIVTVLAVLALAVVGTASAFGYRAMFGGSGTPVPPPVIKADVQPSKVVPATDPNAKPIQDRVGVKTERIVPRQEEPVQKASAPGQPRVIAPFLAGQSSQNFPPASANVAPAAGPAPAAAAQPSAGEPKRIRTVPIKPEQGAEAPAPRSSRNAPAAAAAQPDHEPAPLALAPTGSVPPAAQQRQAARQATAALQNPASNGAGSPFPTPLTGGGNAASGAYGVQVTSQRSEADAQASFRSLQQQFPSVLGGRQPVIRRADLGDKGTYYRAQIPFQSQSEASEFCANLKQAGGQCVVQRN
jgi:hypothetical protein